MPEQPELPQLFEEEDLESEIARSVRTDIEEENRLRLRRREDFRAAADSVAAAPARVPAVVRVTLFRTVASRPVEEPPLPRRLRRTGALVWHEPKDVDLAVWVSGDPDLRVLQRARSRAVGFLWEKAGIGVVHHQVDVFLLAPGDDRYLGRLCTFGTCPKGKPECRVPGCGAVPFLRQHEEFVLDAGVLAPDRSVLLFGRSASFGPPSLDRGCGPRTS